MFTSFAIVGLWSVVAAQPVQRPELDSPAEDASAAGVPAVGDETTPTPPTLPEPPPVQAEPPQPGPPSREQGVSGGAVAPSEIPEPLPTIADEPAAPFADQGGFGANYVRVDRPRFRGTGMIATAGGLGGFTVLFQLGDMALCGGCATGLFEHALMGTSIGLAAGGGALRGGADAYDDAALKRPRRDMTRQRNAGLGMLVAGAALAVLNDAFWFRCVASGNGPYARGLSCRRGVHRVLFDVGTGSAAAGAGLMTSAARYGKHSEAYAGGRVSVVPKLGPYMAGVQLGGRF